MPEKMLQYVGGPLDGLPLLVQEDKDHHPFVKSLNTDTDGNYVMEYQVADQRIGEGDPLTSDDIIARWHQRSSAQDFMTGDAVIVKASGARGTAVGPMTVVNDDGTTEELWEVHVDSNRIFVGPDQIRIATAKELT